MDINIRSAILHNIKTNDQRQLEATIVDAIQSGEEMMLPGLGVLFELIWQEADGLKQEEMLELLEKSIQHASIDA